MARYEKKTFQHIKLHNALLVVVGDRHLVCGHNLALFRSLALDNYGLGYLVIFLFDRG